MSYQFNWRRPLASAYLRSSGSYLVSKLIIVSLIGLLSQYLLTHYLSVENYGLLIWAGTIIALLAPFGLPGISTSITGAVAKGCDDNFRRGTILEIIGGTLGGLALIGIGWYYWFAEHSTLKSFIFIIGGVCGPGLWLDTQLCYWNGKKNFKAIFLFTTGVRIVQFVSLALVLCLSSNPLWVFTTQTLIQVIANICASLRIMKYGRINTKFSAHYAGYGWFATWLYCVGTVSSQIDKLVIGLFFGLKPLAVFAVGELIYNYFFKVPKTMLDQIFVPRLASMDLQNAARWIRHRQRYLISAIFGIVSVVALCLPTGYRFFFSSKYNESIYYAYLFILNIIVSTPILLGGALMRAHGLKKESGVAQMIISLPPLVLIFPCVYLWGLTGAVGLRILQNIMLSIFFFYVLRRYGTSPAPNIAAK
jgi:O-antigen/teichoic acid export membrane protein